MDPVKLDIFQDDAVTAPRLARVLPAVLYNIVTERSYIDFCNKIDLLLSTAEADYMIRANRLRWSNYGYLFWVLWFSGCYFGVMTRSSDTYTMSDLFFYISTASVVACIIFTAAMWIWMNCSTGVTPATTAIREIRDECEAMTNRTPHVSFHVVLTPLATALRAQHSHANPITCIEVSVSPIGFELAKSNVGMISTENAKRSASGNRPADMSHPAVSTKSPVTHDYQQLDIV